MAPLLDYLKEKLADRHCDNPQRLRYITQVRIALSFIGGWPFKKFGNPKLDSILKKYVVLLIILGIILPISGAAYMWHYRHRLTFFDQGHVYLTILLDLLYMQRIILSQTDKYQETIKTFLEQFHIFYFRNKSKYSRQLYDRIDFLSNGFSIFVLFQINCGIILFNFTPFYANYAKGMFSSNVPPNSTFEHAVYYWAPTEDIHTTLKGYWIVFVFNVYMSYNVMSGLAGFDLFLSLIVFQIWGHLKLLKQNLKSFPMPQVKNGAVNQPLMYSDEENRHVRYLLSENIKHHNIILKFTDKCSNTFSEYLFVFYLFHQLAGCVLLLEVSKLNAEAVSKYAPLTVALFQQLIQVSIVFELVSSQSEELIQTVYEMPWECMNTSNRKTVMFYLYKIQTPVSLKACKIVPVGIQTMTGILKTSFVYFTTLTTVAGE